MVLNCQDESSLGFWNASLWAEDPRHTTGLEGIPTRPGSGSICGTYQSSGSGDGLKFHGALSGGQDPKSRGRAHAHRHAPSLEQGHGHRLSRASLLKQSSTRLCLLCWELCLSQTAGPQMTWAAANPHRGAVVSTHFLTRKQATHRHPHSTLSESAALVLLKLICLLALKNTSLGSSRGEKGEEEAVSKMPGSGGSQGLREGRERTTVVPQKFFPAKLASPCCCSSL